MIDVFSKWGDWTDLSVSQNEGTIYILQGRRNEHGKLQLRVERNLWGAYGEVIISKEILETVKKPTKC